MGKSGRPGSALLPAFLFGAVGYPALETLWRGRTHPSMALAGGLCMAGFCALRRRVRARLPLCLLGGAGITLAELGFGLLFNRRREVWDYSSLPLNLGGQVCLRYAALWCLLCLPMCLVARLAERHTR